MLFIKSKYLHRQKILQVLQEKLTPHDKEESISGEIEFPLMQLSKKTRLSEQQILA